MAYAPSVVPTLVPVDNLSALNDWDALIAVLRSPADATRERLGEAAAKAIANAVSLDASLGRGASAPVVIAAPDAPGGRVILALTGSLSADTSDVRSVAESAAAATNRAVSAGAKRPLLVVHAPEATPNDPRFVHALEVAALASLGTQWSALEAREAGKAATPIQALGVLGLPHETARHLSAIEVGRSLCRDIAGTEPERMAPLRVAELCESVFHGSRVSVSIERDVSGYPLLAAVARASQRVERHRPAVIRLEYVPEGDVTRTLFLVGKGVTYDTGGADLKTDGHMAGMSRDKGGAAAVAGLMLACAHLAPKSVRVVAYLGMVRNSIGDEAFVSDEIITARSGLRVRIGNTDAEGRLVLADLLCRAREEAEDALEPTLVSLATLTGHVYRAWGPYIGALQNGEARAKGFLEGLASLGETWAEPLEHCRPRREDYALIAARSTAEDIVSANRLASVDTARGHQFPFAFLDRASGVFGSGLPLAHLDIAGVAYDPPDWQFGRPTGIPIVSLVAHVGNPRGAS